MTEQRSSLEPQSELLTPREVCELLRVSPATLRTWDDRLSVVRLPSGHRRYRRGQIESIARGEVSA